VCERFLDECENENVSENKTKKRPATRFFAVLSRFFASFT
jgi:hypothetical protein